MSSDHLARYLTDRSAHPRSGWLIEVADRGDGAFVATVTHHGEMMCRITRMATDVQSAKADAHIHADLWIDDYLGRRG